MLSKIMIDKLNDQINLEMFSANLYLQMAAWCDHKGYVGSAAFFKVHSGEEMIHMHKLFTYVNETGGFPLIGEIKSPRAEYKDLSDIFEYTLEHEKHITKSINNLVAAAFEEKDFSTFNFLQWYVAEQHEEENLFKTILDKIRIIGLDGKGIYFLDKEINKLGVAGSPTPVDPTA
jgi:ferritin